MLAHLTLVVQEVLELLQLVDDLLILVVLVVHPDMRLLLRRFWADAIIILFEEVRLDAHLLAVIHHFVQLF